MSTFIASRRTSSASISSPLIGPALYLGNRIATSGQTREQAGQSVLQLLWFWTVILPAGDTSRRRTGRSSGTACSSCSAGSR